MAAENDQIALPSNFAESEWRFEGLSICIGEISEFALKVVQNGRRKWPNCASIELCRIGMTLLGAFGLHR